jgi:hypothetical protein
LPSVNALPVQADTFVEIELLAMAPTGCAATYRENDIPLHNAYGHLFCLIDVGEFETIMAKSKTDAIFAAMPRSRAASSPLPPNVFANICLSSHDVHSIALATLCLANANERKYDKRRVTGVRADADCLGGRRSPRMMKVQKPLAKDSAKRVVGTVN